MKLKVSLTELRRIGELLTKSVNEGCRDDVSLHDYVMNLLGEHSLRVQTKNIKMKNQKESAAQVARDTFRRANRKGV